MGNGNRKERDRMVTIGVYKFNAAITDKFEKCCTIVLYESAITQNE